MKYGRFFLIWSVIIAGTDAQRAVVSLGSKLKNRMSSVEGKKVQGANSKHSQGANTSHVMILMLTDSLVFSSDDIVIKDDHVEAMGGLDQADLSFEGIEMLLETKNGKKKAILDGSIRGRARPGRMLAIMGPSGAGKSSVLHALAGRVRESSKLQLFGRRYINGHELAGKNGSVQT